MYKYHTKYNKDAAIKLRREGLSYSEINRRLSISKSTLCYWLKNIELSSSAIKKLENTKRLGVMLGGRIKHEQKQNKIKAIEKSAGAEIKHLDRNIIWIIGIALYWAEGSKEKTDGKSERVTFSNSDPAMVKVFYLWLTEIIHVPKPNLIFELYLHESCQDANLKIAYWEKQLNVNKSDINLYLKHNERSGRSYKSEYNGLIRIKVRRSTDLNRKINGWVQAISNQICSRVV